MCRNRNIVLKNVPKYFDNQNVFFFFFFFCFFLFFFYLDRLFSYLVTTQIAIYLFRKTNSTRISIQTKETEEDKSLIYPQFHHHGRNNNRV